VRAAERDGAGRCPGACGQQTGPLHRHRWDRRHETAPNYRRPGRANRPEPVGALRAGYAWCGPARGRHEDRRHARRPEHRFGQIHIDVARNSTDDFNPFHDPHRFDRILANPYPQPIVLGFQLESCAASWSSACGRRRRAERDPTLRFRNFQFTFADALWRDEACTIDVKPTPEDRPARVVERVLVKKGGRASCSAGPRHARARDQRGRGSAAAVDLRQLPDRSVLPGTPWFSSASSSTRRTPRTSSPAPSSIRPTTSTRCREGPLPRALPLPLARARCWRRPGARVRLHGRPDGVRRAPPSAWTGCWQLRCAATTSCTSSRAAPRSSPAAGPSAAATSSPALPLRRLVPISGCCSGGHRPRAVAGHRRHATPLRIPRR